MQSQQLRGLARRETPAVWHRMTTRSVRIVRSAVGRRPTTVVYAAKKAAAKGFGAPKPQTKGIAPGANCPCGSGALYEACCSPYHDGAQAPTPEALLRSRYSAYAAKEPEYIANTTHPDSPEYSGSRASYTGAVKQTMRRLDPLKLTIVKQEAGATPDEAFITFRLNRRIRDPEVPQNAPEVDEVTERSRFAKINGRWFYMDSAFEGEEGVKAEAEAAKEDPKKGKKLLGLF